MSGLVFDFSLRLLAAGAMGVCIGLEREYRAKEAGYRTHFLVALGSALLMIVSQYGFEDVLQDGVVRLDPSRIAAQVVSGIGFIGAGTIILQKQIIRGLTTAAGIWATSGIGLAIGAGMYGIGVIATILVLLGLEALGYFFKSLGLRNMSIEFSSTEREELRKVSTKFTEEGFVILLYEMKESRTYDNRPLFHVSMLVKARKLNEEALLLLFLHEFPGVTVNQIS